MAASLNIILDGFRRDPEYLDVCISAEPGESAGGHRSTGWWLMRFLLPSTSYSLDL